MSLYCLYESASGFALFEITAFDEIGTDLDAVQSSVADFERFGRVGKLIAFKPFTSAANALEQINAVSESQTTDDLNNFLTMNLPKVKKGKKGKFKLGVAEAKLGSAIQEATGIPCECSEITAELLRGLRMHFTRFVKGLEDRDQARAQLGLAHSYSRAKVKFNVNKVDNMIIQAISLMDTLDKDINTFVMRVREWYSWHFPELVKIVNDNYQYARLALVIKNKSTLSEDKLAEMEEVVGDKDKAQEVLEASRTSMGQDISDIDLINIETFAKRVIELAEYRHKLQQYLADKMHSIAPNLSALIGESVGARLISHAGSLTNLAKYPASTVQILGAEKALFRALKTKGNTPKYGLIFHSTFIGRAKQKNKGRISRYLANKCSIASRIDCFGDIATNAFGEKMREQVEERLRFYEEGLPAKKNLTAMQEVLKKLGEEGEEAAAAANGGEEVAEANTKKSKSKKRKAEEEAAPAEDGAAADGATEAGEKKKKKKKKAAAVAVAVVVAEAEAPEAPKKMVKKKKKVAA